MNDGVGTFASISVDLSGNHCNAWPACRITINGQLAYDGVIDHALHLETHAKLQEKNTISIEYHGKRFGEDNVWDTKLHDGVIISDQNMHVHELRIMGISLRDVWHKGVMNTQDGVEPIPQHSSALHFYKNATYHLEFAAPFYDWLIDFRRQGFKAIGPIWKLSSLNSQPDGYSNDMSELEPILARIRSYIESMP